MPIHLNFGNEQEKFTESLPKIKNIIIIIIFVDLPLQDPHTTCKGHVAKYLHKKGDLPTSDPTN